MIKLVIGNDSNRGKKCENQWCNCKRCNRIVDSMEKIVRGCFGCSETGCDIQGYCKGFKCKNGIYGLKYDNNCTCRSNSDSINCGKYKGQCVNCKFGYYGRDYDQYCNY